MSGGKLSGSLRNARTVIRQSNDPRRTYDPRTVWRDSRTSTGNELGNWSPSTFGGLSEDIQQEQAAESAAADAASHQRAIDMAQQMFGGAYQGATVTGGGANPGAARGMMASPMLVTPQQQPNQGLPMLQNQGAASRGDIQQFLAQMRQQMPNTGYSPLIPRTVMPPSLPLQQAPAGQMGLAGGGPQDWYSQLMRSMK